MARRTRSNKLETRTARLKLEPRTKPYSVMLAPLIHLGYRRNADSPGSWSVIVKRKPEWMRKIGVADDHEDANNDTVLSYWEALEKAKTLARAGEGRRDAPPTVLEAVEDYAADLAETGGKKYNASTLLKRHLPDTLASKTITLLHKRDFTGWRAAMLAKGLKETSVDRYAKSLAAALNHAADENPVHVSNRKAWKKGLRPIVTKDDDDEAEAVREDFILSDHVIADLVRGCDDEGSAAGDHFGLLIHVLAECGSRESQVCRIRPQHLQDHDPDALSLKIPTSRKGSNRKKGRKTEYHPLPISPELAALLRQQANRCKAGQPLLTKLWDVAARFRTVAERLKLDPALTPYSLRYSSIARQLLRNVPIALVAKHHDTSITQIQRAYGRYLTKAEKADELTRAALIDLNAPPPASNVTPIRAALK